MVGAGMQHDTIRLLPPKHPRQRAQEHLFNARAGRELIERWRLVATTVLPDSCFQNPALAPTLLPATCAAQLTLGWVVCHLVAASAQALRAGGQL